MPADSTALKTSEPISPTESAEQLIESAQEQKNVNLLQALKTISKADSLALVEGNIPLYNRTRYFHSLYLFMLGRNEESKEIIQEILPYFRHSEYDKWREGILYNRLGKIAALKADYEQALAYHAKAEEILHWDARYAGLGFTNIYLADVHKDLGNYAEAINHCHQALDYFDKAESEQGKTMGLATLGDIYLTIKDYEAAKVYYTSSLENRSQVPNQQFLIKPLNNLGIIAFEKGALGSAKQYFQEALELIKGLGDFPYFPETLFNLSKIAEKEGDIDKAISLTLRAKQHSILKNATRFEMQSDLRLAELYTVADEIQYTKNLAKKVFNWAQTTRDFELLTTAADIMATCAFSSGAYEEAYAYRLVHQTAKDSFLNAEKIKEITAKTLNFRFEQERRKKELLQKIQETEFQNKIARQSLLRNALIIGLIMVLLFSLLLLRVNYLRHSTLRDLQDKNLRLKDTEQRLETKNDEMSKYIESNMQLENFAYIASHDLKAPLNTIISFSQLLQKSLTPQIGIREQEFLRFIISGASHMQNLIEALLSFSRVDTSNLEVSTVDFHTIFSLVKKDLKEEIFTLKPKIILGTLPSQIEGDPVKLRQLCQNLISNALKFTRPSISPRIEIMAQEFPEHWQFSIQDNGIGISPAHQEKIFMIFKRLHTQQEIEGTGIGLALCKKIVEQHQGKIWVESEEGVGSTFFFTLPKKLSLYTG